MEIPIYLTERLTSIEDKLEFIMSVFHVRQAVQTGLTTPDGQAISNVRDMTLGDAYLSSKQTQRDMKTLVKEN